MSACRDVREWITKEVLVPVTTFITEAREVCEQVKQSIEEKVQKPVEQWVSSLQESCHDWPWPFDWFCELVMVVVKVVVWVVVTVVKWVWKIVCDIVTFVVGIIVTLVLRVIGWFVTFVVCLFSEPGTALKSFGDLWTIVTDTVEDVFELVDVLLGDIDGILGDIENLFDSIASSLGWLGVILGIIKGIIHLIREWLSIVRDAVDSVKDLVIGILSLNLCKILRGLTNLGTALGRALLATGFVYLLPLRVIGAAGGGIRDEVDQHQLENVIREALQKAFPDNSARRKRILDEIGINVRPMGLTFHAAARRMFLSSNSRELNLKTLHDANLINLWALAGYASDCGRTINEPDGEVVYAGTDLKVTIGDLETFLEEGPGSVPEFHVFAISRKKFRDHIEVANRKAAALGVRIFVEKIESLPATSTQHLPLNVGDDDPPGTAVQEGLFQTMGRTGVNDDLSTIPAISHFHYVLDAKGNEPFGMTSWFRPSSNDARISGVTYRNRTPDWGFRFVLAHELGHYWGLNHKDRNGGDRSLDQIMYAPSTGVGLNADAFLEYLLLNGEPRFTLDDARTVWDWITGDGASTLP